MAELPLLIFPKAKPVPLAPANPYPPSHPHFPSQERQKERMQPQIEAIQQQLQNASLSLSELGLEPEMVLVIEIIGKKT